METNRIEYKQELTDDLEKEVVAFLNYKEGGILYIGINKHQQTVGVTDADSLQLKIKDRLKNNVLPSCLGLFDIVLEQKDGKDILKVIVASGSEKPYYIRKYGMSIKGTYIRIGSAAEPMPGAMIETLFAKRTRNSIGKIKSPKPTLSFEQLKIYYDGVGKPLNHQFASNLEMQTEEGSYNYVAYLLADINSISVKVAVYHGLDRVNLAENNEYGYCSLVKATKQVLDKVEVQNKTLTKITSREREEKRLWNPIALREAIINAFVHNDYTTEVPPKFEFFDDRMEITSYGGLPQGLNETEFFEGFSIPRNKELMRIFKDLELVEHLGSGVPRILKSYGKECFHFSENFLRMVLPSLEPVTEQVTEQVTEEEIRKAFGHINKLAGQQPEMNAQLLMNYQNAIAAHLHHNFGITTEKLRKSFGKASEKEIARPIQALMLITVFPEITAEQIGAILGVSARSAETYIQKLKRAKLVDRTGGKKEGNWEILKHA